MHKRLIAVLAGFISSILLSFFVSSASAEEVRSMKLWAREQAAGPAPHTAHRGYWLSYRLVYASRRCRSLSNSRQENPK